LIIAKMTHFRMEVSVKAALSGAAGRNMQEKGRITSEK